MAGPLQYHTHDFSLILHFVHLLEKTVIILSYTGSDTVCTKCDQLNLVKRSQKWSGTVGHNHTVYYMSKDKTGGAFK